MECATGSLLPVQARAGKPPVAPKLYQYQLKSEENRTNYRAILISGETIVQGKMIQRRWTRGVGVRSLITLCDGNTKFGHFPGGLNDATR